MIHQSNQREREAPGLRVRAWIAFLLWALLATPAWALDLKVNVTGIEGELLQNVEAYLEIWQEREYEALQPARVRLLHKRAPGQIRDALAPFGFYNVDVEEDLRSPDGGGSAWVASYRVSPGDPVVIKGVTYQIEGEAREDGGFPQRFALADGDVLRHADWESAKQSLLLAAAGRGYLDARIVNSRVLVDRDLNTAAVEVLFDSGPRYYFGPVTFEQDFLDPTLLQRFVRLEPGEPYDQGAVLGLQGSLLDTEYFRRVEMVPQTEEADPETRQVPLTVYATANKRDKYRIGGGYSTDFGLKVSFDWRRRWVNRRGHRFHAELILAQRLQELSGEYRIPLQNPATEYFFIRPELYRLETNARTEQSASVDAAYSVLRHDWRRNFGVQFRYEDDDIGDDKQEVHEIVPYIEYSRTVSDDALFTSRGYRLKGFLLGTVEAIGSTSSYVSVGLNGKFIRAFADGDYRILARANLGATYASSVDDVPGSRRFFAGGDQSIRGYGFEELGPVDPDSGDVVGGRFLGVGSLELERKIADKWSAALFYDFGNAFDPDYENSFAQSVGAGVRWRSPVGQIRVDLAYGFEPFDRFKVHLVIGPDL